LADLTLSLSVLPWQHRAAWRSRIFTLSHIQIEYGPKVWSQVESFDRAKLPRPAQAGRT
jgi:hypothetical protein